MHQHTARGTFSVQLKPLEAYNTDETSLLGRMSIDKQFSGDVEGVSKGEMLTAMTTTQGSAGYVAVERVQACIHGRSGAFTLQHSSSMSRGEPLQSITVVPDSGMGALTGLSGSMTITIVEKQHHYTFEYTLPE
jgi:hypothetical protein